MADYRTPLPGLFAATLEAAINRLLSMDGESTRRLAQLDQRLVRLELEGLGITLNFGFSPQRVKVSLDVEGEPDTVISGTPTALFSMAVPDGDGNWGTPGSRVKIAGDATLARDLERVFSRLDPDWEAQFSNWFGDVLGYQLAAGARGMAKQFRDTVTTLEEMSGDFLQGPGSPLARAGEIRQFGADVDTLRDATERLEARLRILRQRRAGESGGGEGAA
jgi:ubiquinone biosynthesis accessory factor UbiJ